MLGTAQPPSLSIKNQQTQHYGQQNRSQDQPPSISQTQNRQQRQQQQEQQEQQRSIPANVHVHRSGSVTIQGRGGDNNNNIHNNNIHVNHEGKLTQQQRVPQQLNPSTPKQQYIPQQRQQQSGSTSVNFADAMNSAKQKQQQQQQPIINNNPGYDWASSSASASEVLQTSPTVQAHINEARQRRTQWELKDPKPVPEKSREFFHKVREERFHRNAAAPFATEQSLKVKLESSAGLQDTLMKLGMERTQLEADIIRLEPKSRRKMDARLQKERIEIRLGVIRKESMSIKKKLREMGM